MKALFSILLLNIVSFFCVAADTDEALLNVEIDTIQVELDSVSKATQSLANATQSLSGSLSELASSGVDLSEDNQQKLSEMLATVTKLTDSVNTLLLKLPHTANELPKVQESLGHIASSLSSINNDVLMLLSEYPDFVENTKLLLNNSESQVKIISAKVIDDLLWKLVLSLILIASIVLFIGFGLPFAFVYGVVVAPKKAILKKIEEMNRP
ncbi:TPA: hypothetical protein ACPVZQ_004725 [Vibrio parahaemolyticus]|nr:hypothetical protein [Vibrio parahaemolyticus]MBE4245340.1 hypothetical protein [Vibrio parahaemolyticus]